MAERVLNWLRASSPERPQSPLRGAAVAIAAVGIAFAGRLMLTPVLGFAAPYAFFFISILVIGYFCNLPTILAASVASVLLTAYFFTPPGGTFHLSHEHAVGSVVFLLLSLVLGGMAFLIRTAVGALAARQNALEQSESRFRQITELLPQLVWSTPPDGRTDYYNKRWYEFTGVPEGSTDGEGWIGMFHPDDQQAAIDRWDHSVATGEPYEIEYRLRRHDGQYIWFLGRGLPLRDARGAITRWYGTCTDIHDRKMALAMMETLSHELSHRIKNIFAVITSLIALSVRNNPDAKPFAGQLRKRIDALGRAHDFARPHSDDSRPMAPEQTIFALVRILMEPYAADVEERLTVAGDDIAVADRVATPMALIIHELATNASKYGALSTDEGRVSITGVRGAETYELIWRESGGPPVTAPGEALGFGSRLLDASAGAQLGGEVERSWEPAGVRVVVRVPLASIAREPESAL